MKPLLSTSLFFLGFLALGSALPKKGSLKPHVELKPFDIKCSDCEEYITEMQKVLKDKTQVESLRMLALKFAKDFDSEFEQYINRTVEFLPQIVAEIERDSQLPCKYVGFCGDDRRGAMETVRLLLTKYVKESYKGSLPTCAECVAAGDRVKKNLPKIKEVGKKTLVFAKYSLCKGYSSDCQDFIDGFYNDILADIVKGFGDGKKVCKDLQICV